MTRTLLLVDDEENIIRSIVRLLRREDYTILTAKSGQEGLELLKQHPVGVILSDQRMPNMNGVDFLKKVKDLYPDTIRVVLSGYTDLQSVTDAINEGAIYKFLTKPWEDHLLKANIEEAFKQYELVSENERLRKELTKANQELKNANLLLAGDVKQKSKYVDINLRMLHISQDILESLPFGVLGITDDGTVAVANLEAHQLLKPGEGSLVGTSIQQALPQECLAFYTAHKETQAKAAIKNEDGVEFIVCCRPMGQYSQSQGDILLLIPRELIA